MFQFICIENKSIAAINDFSICQKSKLNFKNLNKVSSLEFVESINVILEISEESESESILIKKSFSFDFDNFYIESLIINSQNYPLSPIIELFIPPPNFNLG